jgi:hypothetical protein
MPRKPGTEPPLIGPGPRMIGPRCGGLVTECQVGGGRGCTCAYWWEWHDGVLTKLPELRPVGGECPVAERNGRPCFTARGNRSACSRSRPATGRPVTPSCARSPVIAPVRRPSARRNVTRCDANGAGARRAARRAGPLAAHPASCHRRSSSGGRASGALRVAMTCTWATSARPAQRLRMPRTRTAGRSW